MCYSATVRTALMVSTLACTLRKLSRGNMSTWINWRNFAADFFKFQVV